MHQMTGISLAHAGKAEVKRASTVDCDAADRSVTRADWQLEKVNYRIPDKVIKSGSFGGA